FQTMSMSPNEKLIDELEKQYEVVQVNADTPVPDDVDVLFAVQPSSLSPEQMKNFIAAVRRGMPTAVFEDPFPWTRRDVPATSAPKRPPQNPMNPFGGGGQPPLPKGNIAELWSLLGVDFPPTELVWQDYNAYPKFQAIWTLDWVYVDNVAWGEKPTREKPFNQDDPITAGLQQVLVLYPGSLTHLNASGLKFEPLLTTGPRTGTVAYSELELPSMMGGGGGVNENPRRKPTRDNYTVAAHITGTLGDDDQDEADEAAGKTETAADEQDQKDGDDKEKDAKKPAHKKGQVNVVLVTDIDMLHSEFFQLRPMQTRDPDQDFSMSLDNVTFVLNVLDELAGDDRFIDIRKRRPQHRTLKTIDETTKEARGEADDKKRKCRDDLEEARAKEQKQLDETVEKIREGKQMNDLEKIQQLALAQQTGQQRLAAAVSQLEKKRDRDLTRIERDLNLKITRVQDWYKMWSVVLPPILPMLVGLAVFFNRRAREREGVSRNRLR
ncbi:MAG: Gldg family protein, partial [Candidatus Saccharimonadales bacterium]